VSGDPDLVWSSIDAPSFDPNSWKWTVADRWVRFYSRPDGSQGGWHDRYAMWASTRPDGL